MLPTVAVLQKGDPVNDMLVASLQAGKKQMEKVQAPGFVCPGHGVLILQLTLLLKSFRTWMLESGIP